VEVRLLLVRGAQPIRSRPRDDGRRMGERTAQMQRMRRLRSEHRAAEAVRLGEPAG
jgi:hypothetical protein